MKIFRLFAILLAGAAAALAACDTEDASHAVVDNAYVDLPVYRAWWVATYFPDGVAGGASGHTQRTVPATGIAYALLAPGWDPASGSSPSALVIMTSKAPLSVARGDTLHIVVSDATFTGNCAAGQPLAQTDADFVTERIFPAEFTNATYDAATCTMTSLSDADAGGGDADAGPAADASDGTSE